MLGGCAPFLFALSQVFQSLIIRLEGLQQMRNLRHADEFFTVKPHFEFLKLLFSFVPQRALSVRFIPRKPSHFETIHCFSLESCGFPASARMRVKPRFWKELRKERKELHPKGNTQASSNTDKSFLRCIAMNNINWGKVPDELTMSSITSSATSAKRPHDVSCEAARSPANIPASRPILIPSERKT